MSTANDIYGLERVVENSIKAVFVAQSITTFTTLETYDFQKDRPRVEVECILGAGQGRWKKVVLGDGTICACESAWKAQVKLDLITEAKPDVHNDFRVNIRSLMNRIGPLVNAVEPMLNHKIQPFFLDGGTSPRWTPQEGSYQTGMIFTIDISVQDSAWALLEGT